MNTLSIILQATAQPGGMANYSGIIMIVLLFVVFYFFMLQGKYTLPLSTIKALNRLPLENTLIRCDL